MKNPLRKLGILTWNDLLYFFPVRYEDFSKITPIKEITIGVPVTIKAKIQMIANRRSWRRRMFLTEALVSDETASIKVIWFNQPYLTKVLAVGDEVYFSGEAKYDKYGLSLQSPLYEKVRDYQRHTARIVPVYHSTAGITQKQIRYLVDQALKKYLLKIKEWQPPEIRKKYNLFALLYALRYIHFPPNWETLEKAKRRLEFDELFLIQLYALSSKQELSKETAPVIEFKEEKTKKLINSLPFSLTVAQKKATWQILKYLGRKRPMNCLLEGDVGSGKTLVAAIAMYNAALNGLRSAIMCPTEILAEQHYARLKKLLPKIKIILQTGKKKAKEEGQIIVGTHALIYQKEKIKNLGLAIIDEQHRFGVKQRQALRNSLGLSPHFLSMTATPIPRSLALTIYGDLDLSILDELPPGRKPVITKLVPPQEKNETYQFIKKQAKLGRQIFVVCPLIDPSDKLGVKAVTAEKEKLAKNIFPDLKIGLIHGRLKNKDRIMEDFQKKKFSILVATPVIEVGIDVPNASVMMIEGAERFGLAQLHQLRGRVQRSTHQSYCFVFTESENEQTMQRLRVFTESNDGFKLAEYDLQFRGPGEVFGTAQTGFPELKIAKLTNYQLINETKEAAKTIIGSLNKYPSLQVKLQQFTQKVHWE